MYFFFYINRKKTLPQAAKNKWNQKPTNTPYLKKCMLNHTSTL